MSEDEVSEAIAVAAETDDEEASEVATVVKADIEEDEENDEEDGDDAEEDEDEDGNEEDEENDDGEEEDEVEDDEEDDDEEEEDESQLNKEDQDESKPEQIPSLSFIIPSPLKRSRVYAESDLQSRSSLGSTSNTKYLTPKRVKSNGSIVATPTTDDVRGMENTPSSTRSRSGNKRSAPRNENEIPSVKDLGIPFRAIKRIMKIDKDIGTVQNEAAMVVTYAVDLFIERIVKGSHENAKKRGRNTVKYEDLAEVRVSNDNMDFLDTLFP